MQAFIVALRLATGNTDFTEFLFEKSFSVCSVANLYS